MIPLPLKPKVIKKEKNKATFEIEALYPGYGVTIGNSLRRVLISSLEGAGVTQMKIKGVPHEFSTIPGVLEDVVTLMLNLKQLRFRIFTSQAQKATLKVKGGGEEDKSSSSPSSRKRDSVREVNGSDFELPAQLELVNKDCHIATLTEKKSELEIEIQVEKGVGYIPREARKKEKPEIGVILLDAIFTPVQRVAFRVENMRVGERTDFDRLFLEIQTDGTISPEEAFFGASEILANHFSLFTELPKEAKVEKKKSSLTGQTFKKEEKVPVLEILKEKKAKPRSRILTVPPSARGRDKIGEALSKFHYGAKPKKKAPKKHAKKK